MSTAIEEKPNKDFTRDGNELVAMATNGEVKSPEQYAAMIEVIDLSKAFQKDVHRVFDPICQANYNAHKISTTTRAENLAPFEKSEKIAKGKCETWEREQKRIAAKKAEADRIAREKAAELVREEEEKILEEAAEIEDPAQADSVFSEAVELEKHVTDDIFGAPYQSEIEFAEAIPKGLQYRDNWKAIIRKPESVPREYCTPDQAKLNDFARRSRGETPMPGVEFINERVPIRR